VTRRRATLGDGDPDRDSADLAGETGAIRVHLDEMLTQRGMTLTELSARVDVTIVNLSILKNGRARAIRFSTMARLCEALQCQPGDLLSYQPQVASATNARTAAAAPAHAPAGAGPAAPAATRAPR
jgi:putative transcriptional regulator